MRLYDAGEVHGAGAQRGTPLGVLGTRFLSYTTRKNSRTSQAESRKAQTLLKQKHILKEKR